MTLTLRNGYTSVFGRIDWNWIEIRLNRDLIVPEDFSDDIETYWGMERYSRYHEWWLEQGITTYSGVTDFLSLDLSDMITQFKMLISEEEFLTTKENTGQLSNLHLRVTEFSHKSNILARKKRVG